MDDIINAIGNVALIMDEISTSSREQSTGIEQIAAAVAQIDGATQQNAALVEEAVATAIALEEQSERLASSVGFFDVGVHQCGMTGAI